MTIKRTQPEIQNQIDLIESWIELHKPGKEKITTLRLIQNALLWAKGQNDLPPTYFLREFFLDND